jgi:hypothetical protein
METLDEGRLVLILQTSDSIHWSINIFNHLTFDPHFQSIPNSLFTQFLNQRPFFPLSISSAYFMETLDEGRLVLILQTSG